MPASQRPSRTNVAWLLALAFALLQLSHTARAQRSPAPEAEWYGWQNLTVDGLALVMVSTPLILEAVADASTSSETNGWLFVFGLSTFALGSPIVDWTNGNVALGFGSLGLHLAASTLILLGAVSHAFGCEDEYDLRRSCSAGAEWYAAGALVAIGALVFDAVLDHEPASSRDEPLPVGLALREDGGMLVVQGAL